MTLQEFYLLYDTRRERDADVDYAGRLDERACDDLYRMLH